MPYPFNIPTATNPIGGYYAHYGVAKPSSTLTLRKAKKKITMSGATQSEREAKGYNNPMNF